MAVQGSSPTEGWAGPEAPGLVEAEVAEEELTVLEGEAGQAVEVQGFLAQGNLGRMGCSSLVKPSLGQAWSPLVASQDEARQSPEAELLGSLEKAAAQGW